MPKCGQADLIWPTRGRLPAALASCRPTGSLGGPMYPSGHRGSDRTQARPTPDAASAVPDVVARFGPASWTPTLIGKNVASLNCFDEHPLGADLTSHAEDASSVRAILLCSASGGTEHVISGRVGAGGRHSCALNNRRAVRRSTKQPKRSLESGIGRSRPSSKLASRPGRRCSPAVRLHLDLMTVNIDVCRIKRP